MNPRQARLFRLLGLVDHDLIVEAAAGRRSRRSPLLAAAGAAACLALLMAGFSRHLGNASTTQDGSSGGAGGAGHDGGSVFMSYAGPAFPLAALEDTPLTAERSLIWDFAPGTYRDGSPRQWGAAVTDRYLLTNPTEEAVTVTALYPFAGNFSDLAQQRPAITADGTEIPTELLAGPYSGGFSGACGAEEPECGTLNLAEPDSWEAYRALLEDGRYQEQALSEDPVLNIPVTVYTFSGFAAPHAQYRAATQAVSFTVDPTRTQILTYGFNGMEQDTDTGWRRYSYFVPDGVTRETFCKCLVVLGEDLAHYTLQGYQDGGCAQGEEIDGVSCTVTRSETVLQDVLEGVCQDYRDLFFRDTPDGSETFAPAMHVRAAAELLTQYGLLSGSPKDRYDTGMLEEIVGESLHQSRVLYLRFPVTVPAGGSVTVEAALWKEPSYDFFCGQSDGERVQGYDLVTSLGSGLTFTGQRAALKNTENIVLLRENFGFDPANGVTEVALDLRQEHYWLELRPRS